MPAIKLIVWITDINISFSTLISNLDPVEVALSEIASKKTRVRKVDFFSVHRNFSITDL